MSKLWVTSTERIESHRRTLAEQSIDICEPDVWGDGIGTNALRVFVNCYFDNDVNELSTQTWFGNIRMIRCTKKLDFMECDRQVGIREVDERKYDRLTFRLED